MTHHDTLRQPQQIEADIQRTRNALDATLRALETRLSPDGLVDRGIDYLRHSGAKQYADNLGAAAKQEPLPLALVGIGLAWLMASGRAGASRAHAGATTTTTTERHPLDGAASDIKDSWSHTTQAARDGASKLGEGVRHGYDHLVHEQPLALGAIGLAIGAVMAAAVPRGPAQGHSMGDSHMQPPPPEPAAAPTMPTI